MASSGLPDEPIVELPVPMAWLENVILSPKAGREAKILRTECQVISKGKGYLSIVTRARLTWNVDVAATSLPTSVIIKQPSFQQLEALNVDGVFTEVLDEKLLRELHNKECDAYEMLTAFEELPPVPIAKCYYSKKRDDTHDGMLILEDFSELARTLHFNDDLDLDRLLILAEHVGQLQSYGFRHPICQSMFNLKPLSVNLYEITLNNVIRSAKFARETYPGELKYTDEEIKRFLSKVLNNIKGFKSLNTEYFTPVVSFGDFQVNNIFWKLSDDGRMSKNVAAIIDFQFFAMNNCLNDLGFDIVVAVDTEVRRRNADAFLAHYLSIVRNNTKGQMPLTMSEVRRIYNHNLLQFGLNGLVFAEMLYNMPKDHGMREGRDKEVLKRAIAAIDDALG